MGNASPASDRHSDVFFSNKSTGDSLDGFRVTSAAGGLAILGPTVMQLAGMPALLAMPMAESIETPAQDLLTWNTASAAVILLARRVSAAIRGGRSAIVHLDSHVGKAPPVPVDRFAFVCSRLSRILIGLADEPAYIALQGEEIARCVLEGSEPAVMGLIKDDLPIVEFSGTSMFAGAPVVVSSNTRTAADVATAIDWFETRRV